MYNIYVLHLQRYNYNYHLQLLSKVNFYSVRVIMVKRYRNRNHINNMLSWTQPRMIETVDKKNADNERFLYY
jgi:hypothetical protein